MEGKDSTHAIELGSAGRTSLEWHRLAGLPEANLACAARWGDVDEEVAQAYSLCHLRRVWVEGKVRDDSEEQERTVFVVTPLHCSGG